MTQAHSVSFKDIPKTSTFYLDYLYNFPRVKQFIPCRYELDHFRKENLVQQPLLPHREELCRILGSQNSSFGAGEKTLENIRTLKEEDCWAVVAGQQVGLFTGPAYTVYKALTAIKLAAHYNCRGVKAVPVFWMATEDHDLAEVDHCYLADTDSQLVQIRYETQPEEVQKPVGKLAFNSSIDTAVQHFLDLMPVSEYRQEIETRVRESYQPGRTFSTSFGEIFSWLFKNYGLILIDPQDARLKMIASHWL
jgi:bacillithiol synthase